MRSLIAHEYMDKFTGRDKLFKSLDQMTGDVDMTGNVEEFAQILLQLQVCLLFGILILNLLFKKPDSKAKYMSLAPSALSKMYGIIHLGYVLLSL